MNDRETIFRPRASNTVETMKPTEVLPNLPESNIPGFSGPFSVDLKDIPVTPPEDVPKYLGFSVKLPVTVPEEFKNKYLNERPKNTETVYGPETKKSFAGVNWASDNEFTAFERAGDTYQLRAPDFSKPPVEDQVQKLREDVDRILDRIAIYNTKSSHKI